MEATVKEKYMLRAIELSNISVEKGGGPFGAVVVCNGEIIAEAHNQVTLTNDPTAHAEVVAIRAAAQKLGTFDLSHCEVYTSCEPCPMCLGAMYWARIQCFYFGNTKLDADSIGFSDAFIYDELSKSFAERKMPAYPLMRDVAFEVFEKWKNKEDKTEY